MRGLPVEKYFGDIWAFFEKFFKIIWFGVLDVGIKTAGTDTTLYGIPEGNAVFH